MWSAMATPLFSPQSQERILRRIEAEPAMFGKSYEGADGSTESNLVTLSAQRFNFGRILVALICLFKLPSRVTKPEAVGTIDGCCY